MERTIFTCTLDGLAQDSGHLELKFFLRQLGILQGALMHADRLESGSKEPTFELRVVDLRHESPATVTLEAVPFQGMPTFGFQAARRVLEVVGSVAANKLQPDEDPALARAARALIKPVGKKFKSALLALNGHSVAIEVESANVAKSTVAGEEYCEGNITGSIEAINIHSGANTFFVYPAIGPTRVRCSFPPDLTQTAIACLGNFVRVDGQLRFVVGAPYPFMMDVHSIEVFPPEEDLPSLNDLRGIAPGLTGGLASEEYVRLLRENGP